MRSFIVLALALAANSTTTSHADIFRADAVRPVLVDVVPSRIFVPQGFDENDNVEVVLDGDLGNTCSKLGPTSFRIDEAQRTVFIRQQAYRYASQYCIETPVSYTQPLSLGVLARGDYRLVIEGSGIGSPAVQAELPVAASSTNGPDDFVYAPVRDVYVDRNALGGKELTKNPTLILAGTFNNSCMKLKKVETRVRPNSVIEVLPIVEISGKICGSQMQDFTAGISLKGVGPGRYLIHVRSLNGRSVNRVEDL